METQFRMGEENMTRDETLDLIMDAICNYGAAGQAPADHPAHWIAGVIEAHCIRTGEQIPTVKDWLDKLHGRANTDG